MTYQVADQAEMYATVAKMQPSFVGIAAASKAQARIAKGLDAGDQVVIRNVRLTYRGNDVLVEQLGEDRKPNGKSEAKPADPKLLDYMILNAAIKAA